MTRLCHCAVFAFSLAFLAALAVPAVGQDEGTMIGVQVERASLPDLPDNVAGRLSTSSGDPISGAELHFWAEVEILGTRSARLGTATTDATGVARVPITPRRTDYRIRVSFLGSEAHAPAETTAELSFPAERVDPVEVSAPSSPLSSLRTVMPRAMGIVVALLWVFFAAAVFYVVKNIHTHALPPDTEPTFDTP